MNMLGSGTGWEYILIRSGRNWRLRRKVGGWVYLIVKKPGPCLSRCLVRRHDRCLAEAVAMETARSTAAPPPHTPVHWPPTWRAYAHAGPRESFRNVKTSIVPGPRDVGGGLRRRRRPRDVNKRGPFLR